jgi:predicted transcriptional regulator of viral defense system
MRTLSRFEARVVLTLEGRKQEEVSRTEVTEILRNARPQTTLKAVDHVISSLRNKGWFERIKWGRYRLIPSREGKYPRSRDKRFK